MAIQMRKGIFDKFDKTRLLPGEYAIVLSGDPVAKDGRAVYICFAAGAVKRLATHEDMYDFLLEARDDTIEYIETVATADVKASYNQLVSQLTENEAVRIASENVRIGDETTRASNESERVANEALRESAEALRQSTIADFEGKVGEGFFDGATYLPSVDTDGVLSWTNDKDKPNPESTNIKGPKGDNGVVVQLGAGMYAFEIRNGVLGVVYNEGTFVPDFKIENKQLYVMIGE
jgi:hypothetical protein